MNNIITYTDGSVLKNTITNDCKQAKLSTSKMEQIRKIVPKFVSKIVENVQDKTNNVKTIVDELMVKLVPTPKSAVNGNVYTNGTRKLKVNSLITDSIGTVRQNCPVEQIPTESIENVVDIISKEEANVPPVLEAKTIVPVENKEIVKEAERPIAEPVNAYQAPLSRVNKIQPSINNESNNVPSVDAYLQRVSRDGIESIETLEMDNQKLVAEINNKKSYLAQLEEELQKIEKEKRIKDLEEEKLGYTSTLQGLSDQIRKLQTEIEEKKQSYGR